MAVRALREVQRSFWTALRRDDDAPAIVQGRFAVYTDAYLWRLQDVLREDFPRLAAVVGAEDFDALTRDYLRRHPSKHPSVRHLGRRMADYLATRRDLAPALADLARLELARTNAFDAADAACLTMDALRAVEADAWPRLSFIPVPSCAVLELDWPAHVLWDGGDATTLAHERTALRVWRAPDFSVLHAPLDPRSAQALRRLGAGEPFLALCDVFADLPPADAAREAIALLARWVEDGMLAA